MLLLNQKIALRHLYPNFVPENHAQECESINNKITKDGLIYLTIIIASFMSCLRLDLTEQKIKFKKRYKELTPAMKIGLTSSQLSWRFLLVSPVPKSN
ncbi:MAG: hypothetical protein QNJ41_24135 [Xenococcaceae cyanobacterium MO_188.B32]|nr:hypothetical protein [Xenococcaceae cyanobacterium MO_188.B32]